MYLKKSSSWFINFKMIAGVHGYLHHISDFDLNQLLNGATAKNVDACFKLGEIFLNEGFYTLLPMKSRSECFIGDFFDFSTDPSFDYFNEAYRLINFASSNGHLGAKDYLKRMNQDLDFSHNIYMHWLSSNQR